MMRIFAKMLKKMFWVRKHIKQEVSSYNVICAKGEPRVARRGQPNLLVIREGFPEKEASELSEEVSP